MGTKNLLLLPKNNPKILYFHHILEIYAYGQLKQNQGDRNFYTTVYEGFYMFCP